MSLRQLLPVWVRQGWHNKVLPIDGLNNGNLLCPGSGVRKSEIKVPARLLPSEDPRKEPAPGLSPSFSCSQVSGSCLHIAFSLSVSKLPLCIKAPVTLEQGPTLPHYGFNLTNYMCIRCFQIHHLLRHWGSGLDHMNFGRTRSIHNHQRI